MVSENTIFFYSGRGGHSHDGENSSFIDTSKYSLFDFSWGLLGDPDRQASQDRNYNSFKDFIINTVNQSILNPAGLVLQPGIVNGSAHIISRSLTTELIAANAITANEILANTITANEIAANAITANELAANLVLVNNVIRSNNFDGNVAANGAITSAGTVGWAVSGHGQAVFDTTFIRGSLSASEVLTPGVDIYSNGTLIANTFALYGNGAIVTSSGNFSVDASGNLSAQNAVIRGEISSETFVTHNRFGVSITYTRPTVLIDNNNDEFQLNTTGGGVIMDGDQFRAYRSGSSFNAMNLNFATGDYSFLGSFYVDGNFEAAGNVAMLRGEVYGPGIKYPGTAGPGSGDNYIGFLWDIPDIVGAVDNAVSCVVGTVSDARSKFNIAEPSEQWIDKTLSDLKIIEFNPVDFLDQDNLHLFPKRLGLIAQDVVNVFPHLTTSANSNDPDALLSVNYIGLVPHLLLAVQHLNNRIKQLENEV